MYPRLRDLREDRNLTQKEVAAALFCNQRTYSGYECGTRDIPTQMLKKMAKYYGVSVDYLLEEFELDESEEK